MLVSALIVVVVSLLFSAFFSGMEIAFLSSNKLKLEIEKKDSPAFAFAADLFGRHSGQYITTILVGNNMALVVYSIFISKLIQYLLGVDPDGQISPGLSFLLETVVATIVIIFVSEFLPKAIVRLNPNFYYRLFAIPVYIFYLLFYPVAKTVTFIATLFLRLFGLKINARQSTHSFDRVDLEHLIDEVSESQVEHENEKEIRLFQNALDFSDLSVRECMVPRIEIEAVDRTATIEELTVRFVDTNYSRLLVYEENIDHVIGYINTKALFRCPAVLDEIITAIDYVPESMPAQRLLTSFIRDRHSVAVVIDEFGGTAGMITIEDILEEIFGEIEDEHDNQYLIEKQTGEKEYVLSGRHEVDYLNTKYALAIPESDDYDTLAGYVITHYRGIPAAGETIVTDHLKIKVLRVATSKVDLLRITFL